MPIEFNGRDNLLFRVWSNNEKRDRNDWISFYKNFDGVRLTWGPASYFDNRFSINLCLGWGQIYIHLPIYSKYDQCDPPKYGFYYYMSAFWMCKGDKVKKIGMPYEYDWIRTSVLLADEKTWEHETRGNRKEFWSDEWKTKIWSSAWPYKYFLKNGEVQDRTATIRIEEREWRQHWLKWTKLFSKVRRTINVDFDQEVGERTGSWKGGVTGCGYEMKKYNCVYETAVETLWRMEKERKFN